MQPLIDALVKQRAERSQTQAGRPNNHVLWTQSSFTDFQETIQGVHKKSVARWWDPRLAGLGEPAGPTLRRLKLRFGLEVKHNFHYCVQLTLAQIPTLEHYK